jgi:hypothetical protein
MIATWTSAPLEIPVDAGAFARADLVFYDVDHSGSSYEARVYLDHPRADATTGYDHPAYAGAYHVLGHGGCFGDEGHCLVPSTPPDPLDPRGPHQLTPQTKTVIVTEAIKRHLQGGGGAVGVTVVAVTPGDRPDDVLDFTRLRLLTYQ